MPKLKTKRSAAKRFRMQARGGFKRSRDLRGTTAVHGSDQRAVRVMLPYKRT
jgi:large subunit ribosomal protein L35